jgi:hypothetical protein
MASTTDFEKAMKSSTPEQQKKGMDAWMKWMEKNKKSIVEGGAPLGKTKRVNAERCLEHQEWGWRLFDRPSAIPRRGHETIRQEPCPPADDARWADRDRRDPADPWDVSGLAAQRRRRRFFTSFCCAGRQAKVTASRRALRGVDARPLGDGFGEMD